MFVEIEVKEHSCRIDPTPHGGAGRGPGDTSHRATVRAVGGATSRRAWNSVHAEFSEDSPADSIRPRASGRDGAGGRRDPDRTSRRRTAMVSAISDREAGFIRSPHPCACRLAVSGHSRTCPSSPARTSPATQRCGLTSSPRTTTRSGHSIACSAWTARSTRPLPWPRHGNDRGGSEPGEAAVSVRAD